MSEDVIKENFNQLAFFTILQFPYARVCRHSVFRSVFVHGFLIQTTRNSYSLLLLKLENNNKLTHLKVCGLNKIGVLMDLLIVNGLGEI